MKGFKAFLLRGNVVELAIAVVIGVAFGVVIAAFVKDLITPLIAALGGQPDFASLYFTINKSKFMYGDFIDALLAFLIIAAVIYFFVVVPYTAMLARSRKEPPADPTTKKCTECLSEIPKDARRCAFCSSPQPA
ncbi:MAG: large conductance mechanosensitive channel protein MscL [Chloroflexi bacterium]|nr:MAG: large conductance mechanosensitive channel protein MscL [Chloroflexota bacterium]